METKTLLDELKAMVRHHREEGRRFEAMPDEILQYKPEPTVWNVLECVEHLNRYAEVYHPAIEKQIGKVDAAPTKTFKPGFLGGRLAKSMLPGGKKVRTFMKMNPGGQEVGREVLDRFVAERDRLEQLLDAAEKVDLNAVGVPISVSRWVKIRLGDALRLVIYHDQRHIEQAQRAVERARKDARNG